MKTIIKYACDRPLLTNLLLIGILGASFLFWQRIGKEEMPNFEMPWLRATVIYPGASAEDVEVLVTRLIEEQLKGLSGLEKVRSTSSFGRSSFRITLEGQGERTREVIQEIKDAFDRADLPLEAEEPVYSRFTSSEKAIIDIALLHSGYELLDVQGREELQKYVLAFESRLLSLPEISGVEKQGYVKPEIQIIIDPKKLLRFDISLADVREQILSHHIRVPVGTMEDREESEITILSELDDVESLENLIVRGGFEGHKLRLGQIANIRKGFAKNTSIIKVQGHEAVRLQVKKSSNSDILSAQKKIMRLINDFKSSLPDTAIQIVPIDDESYDIRNRLTLISYNGLLGFILIIIVLFIFLDFKSGIWVSVGIPFSLAFTLIAATMIGYTVNNMTLAALIIVLGIVVDDAIIIAENVSRLRNEGISRSSAVIEGTTGVLKPIIASILTTYAAFIPLYFFSGHFGLFVKYIPAIVFIMLGASLIESVFILPGHLFHPFPRLKRNKPQPKGSDHKSHWMFAIEKKYTSILNIFLNYRYWVILVFLCILAMAVFLFTTNSKFVMFPREEATHFHIRAIAPENTTRIEMAHLIKPLEAIFLAEKDSVTSVISRIAQSRRGGPVHDNEASLGVELVPPSERDTPLRVLLAKWEKQAQKLEGFKEIRFVKRRFGSSSGSPIQIEIQENDDANRFEATEQLFNAMSSYKALANVEIDRPIKRKEYRSYLKQDEIMRLGVNAKQLASALRAYVEGEVLYHVIKGDEEVDIRLTSDPKNKVKIEDILSLRASNNKNYLVPFSNLLSVVEGKKPANIQRVNYKRTTEIFADLAEGTSTSPLDIADYLETNVFPAIYKKYPTTFLHFRGEIEDSRESQGDFNFSLILVLALIYLILVILYNSLAIPVLIACVIPFGVVGVILAFFSHGMLQYGFFAVIGTLGLIGVVVNDAIVMVSKLENHLNLESENVLKQIASLSASRLRPVVITTLTTVAGLFPTAYGIIGYDSMLAEMMLAMAWGLIFASTITLILLPCLYSLYISYKLKWQEAVK